MNVALRPSMSREEFFRWAEAQEERYEFDGWQPVCMTGGTLGHSFLQGQLLAWLKSRLAGSPLHVLGPDAGVGTVGSRVRYPDVVIAEGALRFSERLVDQPRAVFEIVSPSSSRTDRIVKLREYGEVIGLLTYVILESETEAATLFTRNVDEGWQAQSFDAGMTVPLVALGLELPLAEVYGGMFGGTASPS